MDTLEKVKKIIQQSMPDIRLENVSRESSIAGDLGLDSLSTMMIAILVEDEFKIRFRGEISFDTVGQLCDYIDRACAENKA